MSKTLDVKKYIELIERNKVVIDANVLLQAYQYKGIKFEKIITQLERLAKENRLIIPSNVVNEFNRNRPNLIKVMEQSLSQIIENIEENLLKLKIPPTKQLIEIAPYFTETDEFKNTNKAKNDIKERIEEYRNSMAKLHSKAEDLFQEDPYLERINKLIDKCIYYPNLPHVMEDLIKEAEYRNQNNIPPGYKDKGKVKKGGDPYGDYLLWADILTLKSDVLFITNDNKSDWFLIGNNGKLLDLRVELQEEFKSKTNCSIKGTVSKILDQFDSYFTKLRLGILNVIEDVTLENFYDNYKAISKFLVNQLDTRSAFIHIGSDARNIDENYVSGIEYSHAEMAFDYIVGNITEDELRQGFDTSIIFLEDFWDSRFDRF